MLKNKILLGIVLAAVILIGWPTHVSYANNIFNPPTVQTATATTSPAYMTPGTATSTLSYDSDTILSTASTSALYSVLFIQFQGSSTSAVLSGSLEYSHDGIDWYNNSLLSEFSSGTTTVSLNIGATNTFSWKFASSTVNGAGLTSSNGNRITRALMVPTPVRFVRSVLTITGANGAVWQQFVPTKYTKI